MKETDAQPEYLKDIDRVLFTQEQIQKRVTEIGLQISEDYAGKSLLLVGVLKGVVCFFSDLMRAIQIPIEIDFIAVNSYSPESRDKGLVRLIKDLELPITNRHVLFVEDIIDTGLTSNYLLQTLKTRQPASLEVCTLINKDKRRLIDLPIRYTGFEIPDYYIVGYGLDFQEQYRNVPYIGLLKAEALNNKK